MSGARPPFIIFGLPRSRTAWLAAWLGVGHDLGPRSDCVQGFLDAMHGAGGTVETGAAFAWRVLRHALPGVPFVTVRRPRAAVSASLARHGIADKDELARRDAHLDALEAAGALRVEYDQLADARACALLSRLLTGGFDFDRWAQFDARNIQIDMPAWLSFLAGRAGAIEVLKAEVGALAADIEAGRDPWFYRLAREPAREWWADAQVMAERHHAEVNAGDTPERPLRFDLETVAKIEEFGGFQVHTARVNGRLAAYCTWSLMPDVECAGTRVADQGAWYVDPAYRRLHLGDKLLRFGIEEMRRHGAARVQLHHQLNGRGARAGVLFRRLGAQPLQHRYIMELV